MVKALIRQAMFPLQVALCSGILVAPCIWQARLQAGDLASHVYNSWLAGQARQGLLPGISVHWQWTNILFDLLLENAIRLAGYTNGPKLAVAACVLIFFWGAFGWVAAVSGRKPWTLTPLLAMIAYGWVFHMGLFNFYLSLGCVLVCLALLWRAGRARVGLALVLLPAAWLAHSLPVIWMLSVLGYRWAARRLGTIHGALALLSGATGILILKLVVERTFPTGHAPGQYIHAFGLDQLWVYSDRYYVVFAVTLAIVPASFLRLRTVDEVKRLLAVPEAQILLLSALAVVALPTGILLPAYAAELDLMAPRMSLVIAVCLYAVIARPPGPRWQAAMLSAVCAVQFGMLYTDTRNLNLVEDSMASVVAGIPPGQRVVAPLSDPSSRVNGLAHLVDSVCTGRCFSYGNYEPATQAFRVRSGESNPWVSWTPPMARGLHLGGYVVAERDLPFVNLEPVSGDTLRVHAKITSQVWRDGVVPSWQGPAWFQSER